MFAPRYLKEGHIVTRNAAKMLRYKRDLLTTAEVAELQEAIDALREACQHRDQAAVVEMIKNVELKFQRKFPARPDAGWRENVEVFVVAIVIAVAVRSYFLQPFTIPTGSMQPTLNGILAYESDEPPPNLLVRAAQFAVLGRGWLNAVSDEEDMITGVREERWLRFFTFTRVRCEKQEFLLWGAHRPLSQTFDLRLGRPLKKGEVVARGYVETGDHVFVDKLSYNFVGPTRGEVFVFTTKGISRIERSFTTEGSQYYIKRLAGMPGDKLRIDPPRLLINGEDALESGFRRVISERDGYRGYSSGAPTFQYLTSPEISFTVPEKSYFALGDNSYFSLDSRDWGTAPERNLVGRGLWVYWPFSRHWGLIH